MDDDAWKSTAFDSVMDDECIPDCSVWSIGCDYDLSNVRVDAERWLAALNVVADEEIVACSLVIVYGQDYSTVIGDSGNLVADYEIVAGRHRIAGSQCSRVDVAIVCDCYSSKLVIG